MLHAMQERAMRGEETSTSEQLADATSVSLGTVRDALSRLWADGEIVRLGGGKAPRYTVVGEASRGAVCEPDPPDYRSFAREIQRTLVTEADGADASPETSLRRRLAAPLSMRTAVGYARDFVDSYVPNETSLLPEALARGLFRAGRLPGRQPAGTFAKRVLEELLIDLSWSSSRLEGNRYTLLETEALFREEALASDLDTVMLLNHKRAIEFLVDTVPHEGLTTSLLRNLHALLMHDLLANTRALGAIRCMPVGITDTRFQPEQTPSVLGEMFEIIVTKAAEIRNPIEAAFFLWVQLPYLQPFEDGNKRTSRLAANVPLMLENCAPLSFLDVDPFEYAQAMIGVYEFRDTALAVSLFERTYRRSLAKYATAVSSGDAPDLARVRLRTNLIAAIDKVVRARANVSDAVSALGLTDASCQKLALILAEELVELSTFNCARYYLTPHETQAWIDAGRPK
ncbi:Fic family protein [Pandoraea pneumonica]|uniref:Fic family protein n=1 Tax=Pandoraea pneumonica TaxID=2508299 RepID=UPI003CEB3BE1